MIRIGIVGIGFMGMIHYLAARKVEGAQVTAICSRDPKKLAEANTMNIHCALLNAISGGYDAYDIGTSLARPDGLRFRSGTDGWPIKLILVESHESGPMDSGYL